MSFSSTEMRASSVWMRSSSTGMRFRSTGIRARLVWMRSSSTGLRRGSQGMWTQGMWTQGVAKKEQRVTVIGMRWNSIKKKSSSIARKFSSKEMRRSSKGLRCTVGQLFIIRNKRCSSSMEMKRSTWDEVLLNAQQNKAYSVYCIISCK